MTSHARTSEPDLAGMIRAVVDHAPKCENTECGNHPNRRRLLAISVTRPWVIICPRCGHENRRP